MEAVCLSCLIVGDIPNNTALDESVPEASAGLTTLAHGLTENSGVDTSLINWV